MFAFSRARFVNGFRFPIRVYYEDTDAAGVVYYANYLRFMERARTEWLRALDFEQAALMRDPGVAFVVNRIELDYKAPARLDDHLTVTVCLRRLRPASLVLEQEVWRDRGAKLLVTGVLRVACVELARFRPTALPKELLEKIADVF